MSGNQPVEVAPLDSDLPRNAAVGFCSALVEVDQGQRMKEVIETMIVLGFGCGVKCADTQFR